jgi:hypothetical protein
MEVESVTPTRTLLAHPVFGGPVATGVRFGERSLFLDCSKHSEVNMRADKPTSLAISLVTCACLLAGTSSLMAADRGTTANHVTRPLLQQSAKKYKLYCVNGKIEIGSRDLNEMKAARGDRVCELGAFDTFSQAIEASKRLGGVGSPCPCR